MTKWLSDAEIENRANTTRTCLPVFGDPTPIMEVFGQAKEANRLLEGLEALIDELQITDPDDVPYPPGQRMLGLADAKILIARRIRKLLEDK